MIYLVNFDCLLSGSHQAWMRKRRFRPWIRFAELGRLRVAFDACSEAAISVAQRHSLAKNHQDGLRGALSFWSTLGSRTWKYLLLWGKLGDECNGLPTPDHQLRTAFALTILRLGSGRRKPACEWLTLSGVKIPYQPYHVFVEHLSRLVVPPFLLLADACSQWRSQCFDHIQLENIHSFQKITGCPATPNSRYTEALFFCCFVATSQPSRGSCVSTWTACGQTHTIFVFGWAIGLSLHISKSAKHVVISGQCAQVIDTNATGAFGKEETVNKCGQEQSRSVGSRFHIWPSASHD